MADLKERLRANALDECDEAIDRIEALERQIAAADKLADTLSGKYVDYTLHQALAAYQSIKEQSDG